ncbi:MAG: HMA2 domain-containing protein, partial [Thermoactinomyces sp.]
MRQFKERFIRSCPGRLRTEVYGMQDNQQLADKLKTQLLQLPGVQKVEPCTLTGRVAVTYHPGQVHLDQICFYIQQTEQLFSHYKKEVSCESETIHSEQTSTASEEVAVTKEEPKQT